MDFEEDGREGDGAQFYQGHIIVTAAHVQLTLKTTQMLD